MSVEQLDVNLWGSQDKPARWQWAAIALFVGLSAHSIFKEREPLQVTARDTQTFQANREHRESDAQVTQLRQSINTGAIDVLNALRQAHVDGLRISGIELTGRQSVVLTGQGQSMDRVAKYVDSLSATGRFGQITLRQHSKQANTESADATPHQLPVQFELLATRTPTSPGANAN